MRIGPFSDRNPPAHRAPLATESASSVSSVNFDFTSYMENREAGIVLSGASSLPMRQFINTTYNADFAIAVPLCVTPLPICPPLTSPAARSTKCIPPRT